MRAKSPTSAGVFSSATARIQSIPTLEGDEEEEEEDEDDCNDDDDDEEEEDKEDVERNTCAISPNLSLSLCLSLSLRKLTDNAPSHCAAVSSCLSLLTSLCSSVYIFRLF
jgi:hypothetical protein